MTAGEIVALALALAALAWLLRRARRGGDGDHDAPTGGCGDCGGHDPGHKKGRGAAHEARRAAPLQAPAWSIRRDP